MRSSRRQVRGGSRSQRRTHAIGPIAGDLRTVARASRRQWFFEPLEERRMLDATVVFNELMYHPAAGGAPEWIELYNQMAVNIDLSGWKLSDAVDFTFAEGTVIAGGTYLVVSADPAALAASTGYAGALGPYIGSLANSGEEIELVDQNKRLMDVIEYKDDGKWPVGADGGGVSLAKRHPDAASEDAAQWTVSDQINGTPGAANFPTFTPTPVSSVVVSATSSWKYDASGIAPAANWNAVGYNDATWSIGNGIFGAGDASAPIPVANNSYESGPLNPPPGIGPITGWTGVGNTGSNDLTGTLNNNNVIPDGARVGVIQYVGSLSQSLSGLEPGKQYTLKYYENERGLVASNKALSSATLDATAVVAAHNVSKSDRPKHVVSQPFTATATTATLTLANSAANVAPFGDNALLLDNVQITRAVPVIGNGNLEAYVPSGTFVINPNGSPGVAWSFVGTAGLTRNGSPFQAASGGIPAVLAPEGNQMAFITSASRISQTVSGFEPGVTYSLSWQEGRRANLGNANDLEIVLDAGLPTQFILSSAHLVTNTTLVERTSSSFFSTKSSYTLTLRTTNPLGGSSTTFVDDLHFNFVTEAPPVTTPLPLGASTYYFRAPFTLDELPSATQLTLNFLADDGAVFYLNGQEIHRTSNLPAGQTHGTPAVPGVSTPAFSGQITVPATALVNGANVLAIEVHQASPDGDDVFFGAGLTAIVTPQPASTDLILNEVSGGADAETFVEITNIGATSVSTESFKIVNSLGGTYSIPTQIVAPGAKLAFDQATLGFHADTGARILLTKAYGNHVPDAVVVENAVRGRLPDGDRNWQYPDVATPGAVNSFVLHDEIVINEIMYHHRPTYKTSTTSYAENPEQWIELYNRSNHAVDLSLWRLDDGAQFTFPQGTSLAAGGYLVVAQDAAALLSKFPGIAVVGPLAGELSNSGERIALKDAAGNLADEVHYYEDGNWDARADGGGSSLELRDPRADNSAGGAWTASNELLRTQWQHYTYTAVAIAPVYDPVTNSGAASDFRELRIGLLDTGEALLDNISVIESPGGANTQLVQNGTFSGDAVGGSASKWRFLGTHSKTRVELDPSNAANKVLRVVAQSRADYLDNLLETTTVGNVPIVPGRTYQISFDARFLSGSPQLRAELYYNRVVTLQILNQPSLSGTPGAQNSTYQANRGPTYDDLRSSPAVPAVQQSATVTVQASDPDSVASLTLYYSVAGGAWLTTAMTANAQGRYTGTIPGQAAGTVVQFYVQGQDTLGAVSTYPAAGPLSRALIKWNDGQAQVGPRHSFRMIMTQADINKLFLNTNLMSNERLGGTVVYDETEVFYDVGIRLRGSMFSRVNLATAGYNISFPQEHLFRGVHSSVTMKTPGKEEIIVKHSALQLGVPEMYDDFVNMISPAGNGNGIAIMSMARYGDEYTTTQFEDGDEGTVFKMQGIRVIEKPAGAGPEDLKIYFPVGWVFNYDLTNLGNDQEQYRWSIQITNNRARDDYAPIVAMMQSFALDGLALEQAVANTIDVDQWMRVFALQSLWGIGDAYMQGNPHNLDFYVRPSDGKVLALPWDWNFVASYGFNAPLYGIENRTFTEVIDRPIYRRLYYGHMLDMINTSFNPAYLTAWATSYGSLSGLNLSNYANYSGQRGTYVTQQFATVAPNVPFNVTTPNGQSVNSASTTVTGAGWIDVREIRVDGYSTPLEVTWTGFSNWQATVPLAPGAQTLTFRAFNHQGVQVGTDTMSITSTLTGRPLQDYLRVSELQYHPADPNAAEIAAGFANSDSFEFIELLNVGPQTLDLAGAEFTVGVTFDFDTAAIKTLAPGQRLLIAENSVALQTRYGAGLPLAGQYSGKLDNAGERILLVDSLGVAISDFTYSDTWHPTTDGQGPSLQAASESQSPTLLSTAGGWRASYAAQGTPAAADPLLTNVVGRHIFYNNSEFDGNDDSADASDDAAIAAGKSVLLPTAAATGNNYTSYSRGINGIMIDIASLASPLTAADFAFRIGNDNDPAAWPLAPAPSSISVRNGAGVGGSARVTIVWPDGAIKNTWLQVTLLGAGLAAPDVFYVGNAVGESGDSPTNAQVNAADEVAVRNHPQTFLAPATLANAYDFNRDGLVNATDQILARGNSTTLATALKLISVPGSVQAAAAGAQSGTLYENSIAAGLTAPATSASSLPASPILGVVPPIAAAVNTERETDHLRQLVKQQFLAADDAASNATPEDGVEPDDKLYDLIAADLVESRH